MTAFSLYVWQQTPRLAVERFRELEPQIREVWTKQADIIPRLLELSQIIPARPGSGIPNRASPLLGMLVGGMAGSGLGYGAGWLTDKALPDRWEKDKWRRTLTVAGGLAGASLPAAMGAWNVLHGRPFNSMEHYSRGYSFPAANLGRQSMTGGVQGAVPAAATAQRAEPALDAGADFAVKQSFVSGTGLFGKFDPDAFNEMLWSDPRITGEVPVPTLAAASGLVTGAANLPGRSNSAFVTPFDIARMSAGMGSGYVSGLVVGKALGGLMGMPEETQEKLKNTGMFAGLLRTIIPVAFGG